MKNKAIMKYLLIGIVLLQLSACKLFKEPIRTENKKVPNAYTNIIDTTSGNVAKVKWRNYFTDPNLVALIDTALKNNQELNITMQEIKIAVNEIKAKKGAYLPNLGVGLAAGADKSGKYTWDGLAEEDNKAHPGVNPKYIGDFNLSAIFSWELDIWKKLRNEKNAAVSRYLASVEGKNFMVSNLVAEIANTYYELEALDNQLAIIQQNISIQENALHIIKQQKDAGRETQLAVNRFEAQLLNTKNLQYDILQQITETENEINFLTARFPAPIVRSDVAFNSLVFDSISAGVPSQLLENRPDIRQAEQQLAAAKLDVKVAKANFYPNIRISAALGFQAFNPAVWFKPESILYNIIGDLFAPLVNRNEIKANYQSSRAKQVQAVISYEQTILKAFLEVENQLSSINNYTKSYETKSNEVEILNNSITISDNLFKSAKADYLEVLLTQREALESKMELIEIKKKQLHAEVSIYKALGGGWN